MAATQTAHAAASAPRANLPAALTSFIGRESEIADLVKQVKATRLLTLTGSGGVGKSRLALEVARQLPDAFVDGVWLVELAPLSDPALVPQAVVAAFKLPEQPGRTPLDALIGYLETKHLLLILDNCEHLIDACAALAEALLQRCPQLHVLATSRDRLRVLGEVTHRVPSLTTPDGDMSPDDLMRYESVRLFRERASASQSTFEWSPSEALAVAQICNRLDGIPLAIELATARLNVFTAEKIVERLNDRFSLLVTGSRTALPRHQTLRAAIAWSYDLLAPPEQKLLMRLSVFAGGFTAEAAEFVAGQADALTLLSQLVDKSLVMAEVKDKAMRYRLLETIRQFASDRLSEIGAIKEVRDQHLKYFLELAERAEPELFRADQVAWLDRLETEMGNIRAALDWSLEDERQVEAGLRLGAALKQFWHIRDYRREGIDWLERALSLEARTRGTPPRSQAHMLARALALGAAGVLREMVDTDFAKAVTLSEEAVALSRELGEAGKRSLADAQWNLTYAAVAQKDYRRAQALSEEGLALYREIGDKAGMASCLDWLAYCDHVLMPDEHEQARAIWEEALALRKEVGDKDGMAHTCLRLGLLAFGRGDLSEATAALKTSLALFDEVGNRTFAASALSCLGMVAHARGDYQQAVCHHERALALRQSVGNKVGIAVPHVDLAVVASSQGDYQQAASHFDAALSIVREMDDQLWIAFLLCRLGSVALAQGDVAAAVNKFESALEIARANSGNDNVAVALFGLGQVAQMSGNAAKARTLHREALVLRREARDPEAIASSLEALAAVENAQGQAHRAARLLGATETTHEQWRFRQSPFERDLYERAVTAVRSKLNEAAFAAAWAEGRAMTLEQAVDYALSESDTPSLDAPLPSALTARESFGGLTSRECEAVTLIAHGKSNREIAEAMVVSVKTVETYVTRILHKLGFDSRVQIATWAVERGLTTTSAGS